ncbi:hypothetical protein [Nonomuraea africana]|uniref:Uncharacterized protein n=1 Tax=Nonomuraea africana TaxID=46171 RepID=A0ABR9KSG9_9ACTN|nr:hypothetical protein [Nonomuraea africana]MBE1564967.1 hypothetical protein [Nonomuraea africana]
MSPDWASALLPLGGVILGFACTLIGQFMVTRETKRQALAKAAAARREERKQAIMAFMDVCQEVGTIAQARHIGGGVPEDVQAKTDLLWVRQRFIDIVGSPSLRRATHELAERLTTAMYRGTPSGVSVREFLREDSDRVIQAAREELGFS